MLSESWHCQKRRGGRLSPPKCDNATFTPTVNIITKNCMIFHQSLQVAFTGFLGQIGQPPNFENCQDFESIMSLFFMIFCKSHGGWVSGWSGKGNRSSWWVGNGKLEVKLVRGAGQVNGDTFVSFWNRIQAENKILSTSHTFKSLPIHPSQHLV